MSGHPGRGDVIEVELAQGLGLLEALTIGIGTMIGAGIFVLPGFIIARAGPAAVVSFLLGGVVAMFCAMAAAEVATGMPRSGGGYYFISRALGPVWGAIIGWGSWFGLIFATAFYAVGFGEYVHAWIPVPVKALALAMIVGLVALNLVGSDVAGKAQNLIVAVLVGVMVLFVARGSADVDLSFLSEGGLAPLGLGAIFASTAVLFVTYCGFGEIASMAEEIRDPGKNLPRALLWSVGGVTVLYVIVVGIVVLLGPWQDLTSPTVVADLAGSMMGPLGGLAILVGAVMATVSSANASIMSASRISFAMGRDRMMWEWLNNVHPKYRVPHRAIYATGALILGVTLLGDIELLAEAAGLLHLLMYGLICVAAIVLRGARPMAYRPVYRVPLFPWIPLAGALGTLVISFFMSGIVVLMGVGIILFALGHYAWWGRTRTEVRGAWPYFLRRAVLEPAMERVEGWGAPESIPTAVVAVTHPDREGPRLEVAGALLGPTRGRALVTNVFREQGEEDLGDDVLERYRQVIDERTDTLRELSQPLLDAGARVQSHVPIAHSVLRALLSAVEASQAAMVLMGWPGRGEDGALQVDLLAGLERHARAHMLLLREHGRIPPRRILVLVGPDPATDLPLLLASRMSTHWGCELTVLSLLPPEATSPDISAAELALESLLEETVRARFLAVAADSALDVLDRPALSWDMAVLGVPPGAEILDLVEELDPVLACSLVVVRPHASQPVELWM